LVQKRVTKGRKKIVLFEAIIKKGWVRPKKKWGGFWLRGGGPARPP